MSGAQCISPISNLIDQRQVARIRFNDWTRKQKHYLERGFLAKRDAKILRSVCEHPLMTQAMPTSRIKPSPMYAPSGSPRMYLYANTPATTWAKSNQKKPTLANSRGIPIGREITADARIMPPKVLMSKYWSSGKRTKRTIPISMSKTSGIGQANFPWRDRRCSLFCHSIP